MNHDRRMQLLAILWILIGGWTGLQSVRGFFATWSDLHLLAAVFSLIVTGPLALVGLGFAWSGLGLWQGGSKIVLALRVFSPFLFLYGAAGLASTAYFFTRLDRYEARDLEVTWINHLDSLIISGLMILVASVVRAGKAPD